MRFWLSSLLERGRTATSGFFLSTQSLIVPKHHARPPPRPITAPRQRIRLPSSKPFLQKSSKRYLVRMSSFGDDVPHHLDAKLSRPPALHHLPFVRSTQWHVNI
jgi:hypothetical protein